MQWHELKRRHEAPKSGWMLAYTRKEVIFHAYESHEAAEEDLAGKELLELHLFDEKQEYRSLSSRSKRFEAEGGIIETVENFSEEKGINISDGQKAESVYSEEILLSQKWGGRKITVLNHISYNQENGMAVVDNYRLKM